MTTPKCPKDADNIDRDQDCLVESKDWYICTRNPKHKGKHHAHSGDCLKIW